LSTGNYAEKVASEIGIGNEGKFCGTEASKFKIQKKIHSKILVPLFATKMKLGTSSLQKADTVATGCLPFAVIARKNRRGYMVFVRLLSIISKHLTSSSSILLPFITIF